MKQGYIEGPEKEQVSTRNAKLDVAKLKE